MAYSQKGIFETVNVGKQLLLFHCRQSSNYDDDGQFIYCLCETEFKTRWYNHKQTFKNRRLSNATELSKYI